MTPRHFAWQAWHNLTSTFVSRGRRGTNSHPPSFCVAGVALMVLGGALGPGFGACDAAALCVAGVAQPDIHLRFTWQAWHKVTSTVVLRGRHTHTDTHTDTHTHTRTHTQINTHTQTNTNTNTHTHAHTHTRTHAHIHTHAHTHTPTHTHTSSKRQSWAIRFRDGLRCTFADT